jgi:hypothetical protein
MGEAIDRLAKALASGVSRRSALGGVLAGSAVLLPWTAAAKKRKKKRKQERKVYRQYLEYCHSWCGFRFGSSEAEKQSCNKAAKKGKGPCYSATEQGPGYFCHKVTPCGKNQYCCPLLVGGSPVTEGRCCPKGTFCPNLNGTTVNDLCAV